MHGKEELPPVEAHVHIPQRMSARDQERGTKRGWQEQTPQKPRQHPQLREPQLLKVRNPPGGGGDAKIAGNRRKK